MGGGLDGGGAPGGMLGSRLNVEFGVLLSAVMAVSVGGADDDPL